VLAGALAVSAAAAAQEALCVVLAAIAAARALMLFDARSVTIAHLSSYGTSALLLAGAAAATAVLAVRAPEVTEVDLRLGAEIAALLAIGVVEAAFWVRNLRDLAGPVAAIGRLPAGISWRRPARVALLVQSGAAVVAALIALAAVVLARGLEWPAGLSIGALAIAFATGGAATFLLHELRRHGDGMRIAPRLEQMLIDAVGRAAMQSGAIRQVGDVSARYAGAAAVIVMVQLQFKDGVDARHIAPVLSKLEQVARAAVPEVGRLVLAGDRMNASQGRTT